MSQETKARLELLLLVLSIGAILLTAAKSFILLPERIDSVEVDQVELRAEFKSLSAQRHIDNALLQRIDERTEQIIRELQENKRHRN